MLIGAVLVVAPVDQLKLLTVALGSVVDVVKLNE